MRILADTHLLFWAAVEPAKLGPRAAHLLVDPENEVLFSAASIWEVAIKAALTSRSDFRVDAAELAAGLREHGWTELPVTARHAAATSELPPLHRDPFDRILLAQSRVEALRLITRDRQVAEYGAPVELV